MASGPGQGSSPADRSGPQAVATATGAGSFRRRWLSARALRLHLMVLVIAPGCGAAGWWQATRALSGNGLSWVYSVEWPLFGVIAIGGWWQLVHEAPEAYQARKAPRAGPEGGPASAPLGGGAGAAEPPPSSIEPAVARRSLLVGLLVAIELVLGVVTIFFVPVNRPSGWWPEQGQAVYLAHAVVGLALALAAAALSVTARRCGRTARAVSWTGLTGVLLAGAGGCLTSAQSLVRFFGLVLMFVGPVLAGFSYAAPLILARAAKAAHPQSGGPPATVGL